VEHTSFAGTKIGGTFWTKSELTLNKILTLIFNFRPPLFCSAEAKRRRAETLGGIATRSAAIKI
jgi:hypothetical protein